MKRLRTIILILGFAVVLCMPMLLKRVDSRFGLTGVSVEAERPVLTKKGLLDGTVQTELDNYVSQKIPGRDLMIKVRNQLIFTLYDKSPNQNIVIGKNRNLFEKEYVLKYEKVYPPADKEFVVDLCEKLTVIQDKLEAKGKELYLFITPTKVRYYEEDVPDIYRVATSFGDRTGNYEVLTETLEDYDFKVYDSIPFVAGYRETADAAGMPLYYKTGSHWSLVVGAEVASDLTRFLDENSAYSFPETHVEYAPVPTPLHPDSDIFNVINVFTKPYDSYYTAEVKVDGVMAPEEERPNMFCRGGSFMGQTLNHLINDGMFQKDTYVENTIFYRNGFSEPGSFSDYGELNLKEELEQADIVILEVNEAHIPVMSFGLIDYLIEHPELLD